MMDRGKKSIYVQDIKHTSTMYDEHVRNNIINILLLNGARQRLLSHFWIVKSINV